MAEGFTNSLNNYGKLSLTNNQIRQGEFINTSKSFHESPVKFLGEYFSAFFAFFVFIQRTDNK